MLKKKLILMGIVLIPIILFAFSGCDALIAALTSVSGKVVDARSDLLDGVGSVQVTLTAKGGSPSYSTTTDSTGYFSISNVDPGEYKLTASANGWFFVPKEVYVGGMAQDLGNVLGLELSANDIGGLSFIVVWNSQVKDVDIHLSFPTSDLSDDYDNTDSFGTPYSEDASNWYSGFGPVTTGRETVYYYNPESTYTYNSLPAAYLDRDDTDYYGPETLTLRFIPFSYSSPSYPINATTANGLDIFGSSAGPFRWMGVAEVYLDGYSDSLSNLANEGQNGAEARLYVIQTKGSAENLSGELLGYYKVPDYTRISTASILRINMFVDANYEYFQLVPDIRVIPEGASGIKTLEENSGIVFVRGRKRR